MPVGAAASPLIEIAFLGSAEYRNRMNKAQNSTHIDGCPMPAIAYNRICLDRARSSHSLRVVDPFSR
jgi:hypothetical protein